MAAAKVRVSIDLDFSDEASSSRVKALIRVEAAQTSDIITIPVALVFDVQGTHQQAAGAELDVTKMEELIRAVFCGPERNADILVIRGDVRVTYMREGVTKFKPVLRSAIEELQDKRPSSVGPGPRGFIILLSDGGSKLDADPALCKDLSQYPVHAIGLGSNHDSEVLQRIVTSSKGTYSYIPVTDDKEKLNRAVVEDIAKCLGGLMTVVAVDTCVKISVPEIKKGILQSSCNINKELTIAEIQSGAYGNCIIPKSNGRKGKISVDCLCAGEVKQFIVHLAFKSRTRACELTAVVVESHSHNEQQLAKCEVPFIVNSSSLKAYTQLKQQLGPNPALLEHMIRSRVVQVLVSFAERFQGGSKEKAARQGQRLRQSCEELLKRLEGGNLGMAAAHLHKRYNCGRVDLIKGIGMDIEAMASCLERGWGLGCIYSWVSSYEMQRPTTTGLPPPATFPFLTPAMEEAARNVSKHYLVAASPPGGGAAGSSSSSSTTRKKKKQVPPTAAQPGGTGTDTTLDDYTKRQRGKGLLDDLVPLFEQLDKIRSQRPWTSSSNDTVDKGKFWNQLEKVVEAAINGTRMTTTSGSGDKEMPAAATTLQDRIKSTIAIWLFDCIIDLKKGSSEADLKPIMPEIYEVAKKAVSSWKKK